MIKYPTAAKPTMCQETMLKFINQTLQELAQKYNIPFFNMGDFGRKFIEHSDDQLSKILADLLHFGDLGHGAESGFLFSMMTGRAISLSNEKSKVTYMDYAVTKDVNSEPRRVNHLLYQGFKVVVDGAASNTDTTLMDFYILNDSTSSKLLKGYCNGSTQYVKIECETDQINESIPVNAGKTSTDIYTLKVGRLYRIRVYSGVNANKDWYGFTIN